MNNTRKKVYIAVLNQGGIRPELVHSLQGAVFQNKYELLITYPSAKPISHNRNSIVQNFLQRKEFDYLIMIDSDIVPPVDFLTLVDFQKDIISPVCFMFQQNMVIPLIMERKSDGMYNAKDVKLMDGLVECDAVGSGCIIMSRKVLEAVKYPFRNEYDADGIKLYGLDFNFCHRAKKLGFKVFCHLDYKCSHWTTMDLKEIYASLSNLLKK